MKETATRAPTKPGVYLFFDQEKNVLYVGKAKNLRARLKSYFLTHVTDKTRLMVSKASHIETIITRNEVEALLLENKLIIQHKPPYNIMLKDTQRYAWIVVTDEQFPRILTARNKKRKGIYYGPYTDGSARRAMVITLNKTFKLRTCRVLPKNVCLQYHIKNCTGPCAGHDTAQGYSKRIAQAQAVLEGKTASLLRELKDDMARAAQEQKYEVAKDLRDALRAIQEVQRRQVVDNDTSHDQEVIAFATNTTETVAVVLTITRGVIAKKQEYRIPSEVSAEEFLTALHREALPPKEIITELIEDTATLEAYFGELAQSNITITTPQRGEKHRLLLLAKENASSALTEKNTALLHLKEHLNLSATPSTIDCFDVSTLQGTSTVAACVRYRNGQPDPSGYRKFSIRGAQQDDFAGIEEAVTRRYAQGDLPDLIVIDGGKGQLAAAMQALPRGTPLISLAKQEEEVFVPGLRFSLNIPPRDPGLLLLRRIRDATHRQAVGYHRTKRGAHMTESALDHIPGLGEKRKAQLYAHFKTYENMQQASKEQLQGVLGKKIGAVVFEEVSSR
jgi:excinuclease ABC subunit C